MDAWLWVNKRLRATTWGAPTSLFRREQLAGENIAEVQWGRAPANFNTSFQLLLRGHCRGQR
jgi:hypothetical protein